MALHKEEHSLYFAETPQEGAVDVYAIHTGSRTYCWSVISVSWSVFQSIVGAEGLSLAFRHIISSLLWYCSQHTCEGLLHEVIVCVGYFTVNNPDNQVRQMEKGLRSYQGHILSWISHLVRELIPSALLLKHLGFL